MNTRTPVTTLAPPSTRNRIRRNLHARLKKLFWPLTYVTSVLVFSLIYYGCWLNSTDSFIVNGELNLAPLARVPMFAWDESLDDVTSPTSLGLSVLNDKVQGFISEIGKLKAEVESLDSKIETLRREQGVLGKDNQDKMLANGKRHQEQAVATAKLDVANAERTLTIFTTSLSAAQQKDAIYQIAIADMRIKIADLKVIEAKLAAEAAIYVVNNFAEFGDAAVVSQIDSLYAQERTAVLERQTKWDELVSTRRDLVSLANDWRAQRASAVGWPDFLLFSIGISTTTTYGDVVGNSRFVRSVIALQLLMCIFIMAKFVSSVVDDRIVKRDN